jgi:pimeloyl-ACP methyl ester carboxylesterase
MIARAIKVTRDVARLLGFSRFAGVQEDVLMLSRLLEHVFFETFERRAAVVGANGVSQLIWELMSESADHCTKVHLVGHSLGCHVMSSAAARGSPSAGDPNWVFPRKIHSMSLLQGAVPMTAYAKPGAYRVLTEGYPIVAGPVIATTSRSDLALQTYALFKGKPLGRDGFPDLGAKGSVVDLPAGLTQKLGFQNGRFYTLDADPVISIESLKNGLDVVGAHCDIFDKEIQQCIWEAAHTEMDEKDYVIAVV